MANLMTTDPNPAAGPLGSTRRWFLGLFGGALAGAIGLTSPAPAVLADDDDGYDDVGYGYGYDDGYDDDDYGFYGGDWYDDDDDDSWDDDNSWDGDDAWDDDWDDDDDDDWDDDWD